MENQVRMAKFSKALSIVLGIIILGAVAAVIYAITVPAPEDAFTEFYLLGPGGKAADYPVELKVDREAEITLVIVNREHEAMSYRVEIMVDGITRSELGPVLLEHDGMFEHVVNFTPENHAGEQTVEFLLYNQRQSDIYDTLYLLVKAKE